MDQELGHKLRLAAYNKNVNKRAEISKKAIEQAEEIYFGDNYYDYDRNLGDEKYNLKDNFLYQDDDENQGDMISMSVDDYM